MKKAPARISVGRAITVGLLWVNGPILPIMFGLPAAILFFALPALRDTGLRPLIPIVVFASIPSGFTGAWLWWSINVPVWRLWAYERVDDIAELKQRAVKVGLTWPDGHFFERTEWKSKERAAREREFGRSGGPR